MSMYKERLLARAHEELADAYVWIENGHDPCTCLDLFEAVVLRISNLDLSRKRSEILKEIDPELEDADITHLRVEGLLIKARGELANVRARRDEGRDTGFYLKRLEAVISRLQMHEPFRAHSEILLGIDPSLTEIAFAALRTLQ